MVCMTSRPPEVFFLPGPGGGQRLAVLHEAAQAPRGLVVYAHPFAEEMNKARRMAALQSRAWATAGWSVLCLDLLGCGDSSGDFGDAGWDDWVEDLLAAVAWMRARHAAPLTLWGLRAGCLLASEAARRLAEPVDCVFWQAPASGKLLLQQFLRLKVATQMGSNATPGLMQQLRTQLAEGQSLDVAGYRLSPALAAGLEAARLDPPAAAARLAWLEVTSRDDGALLPASQPLLDRWQAAGAAVQSKAVQGPAFWQTTEIEDAPALVEATLAFTQAACEEPA
jgi:uncharacterized protein